jgi:hypothetical protein
MAGLYAAKKGLSSQGGCRRKESKKSLVKNFTIWQFPTARDGKVN